MSRFGTLLRVAWLVPMVAAGADAPGPDEVLSLMQLRAEKIELHDSQSPTLEVPSILASSPATTDVLGTSGLSPAAQAYLAEATQAYLAGAPATAPAVASNSAALSAELAKLAATPTGLPYTAALPAELEPLAQTLSSPATLSSELAPLAATPTALPALSTDAALAGAAAELSAELSASTTQPFALSSADLAALASTILGASDATVATPAVDLSQMASPQPAGWGPEAAMPEAVQPAGWGGLNHRHAELSGQRMPALVAQEAQLAASAALAAQASVTSASSALAAIHAQPAEAVSFVKSPMTAADNQRPAGWGPGPQKAMVSELGTLSVEPLPTTAPLLLAATSAPASPVALEQREAPQAQSLTSNATLNDVGYKSLVSKGTPEMVSFIRRVGESRDYEVINDGSLAGFARFYSGESSSSSFQHLVDELDQVAKLPDAWLRRGRGASAPLNQAGYEDVAANGTPAQMASFVRRIVKAQGLSVANEGSLAGLAAFYHSGHLTLNRLANEIGSISKLPDGWLKRGSPPPTGLSAPLDDTGFRAVQSKFKGGDEMSLFVRRIVETHHDHIADEGGLQGFAKFYSSPSAGAFSRMVQELDDAAKSKGSWVSSSSSGPTGLSVSLDEAGRKTLQDKSAKGSQEMPVFIRRVAEARLYGVANEGGLQGFAKFYSGQSGAWSFGHMEEELDRIRTLPGSWLKGLGLD